MLKDILALTGEPGLYKLVSKNAKGVIVENVETKRKLPYYTATKISTLEDIAIFTESEDVPLRVVFKNIFDKENGGPAINHKSSKEDLIKYFNEVLPSYDKNRVYPSDIKKAINWYNILQKNGLTDFSEPEKNEDKEVE